VARGKTIATHGAIRKRIFERDAGQGLLGQVRLREPCHHLGEIINVVEHVLSAQGRLALFDCNCRGPISKSASRRDRETTHLRQLRKRQRSQSACEQRILGWSALEPAEGGMWKAQLMTSIVVSLPRSRTSSIAATQRMSH